MSKGKEITIVVDGREIVATEGETPVAVCGLNRDPYLGDPGVGRVRHLYVLKAYRHLGLGRSLVQAVMDAAQGHFHMLTLRTENPVAARLYVSLGFVEEPAVEHATHWCRLSDAARWPSSSVQC